MKYCKILILLLLINICSVLLSHAQSFGPISQSKDIFSPSKVFVENIGQYGNTLPGFERMGSIKYGFEGFDMPVLFTEKGLIHLQRKVLPISEREVEKLKSKGIPEEEIEKRRKVTDKIITMEWLGANPQPEIITEEKTEDYHTYGLLKGKAFGYKKIIYKNLYSGIEQNTFYISAILHFNRTKISPRS